MQQGHVVVAVDNLRTGRRENLQRLEGHRAFRLVDLDVADPMACDRLVAQVHPDTIIHLAALVSVPESIRDPSLNFRLNVIATHVVAEAARRNKTERIVFASSAAVYGDCQRLPLTEREETRPINPYGGAKLASEALLMSYGATFGITVRCLRYFNVYGPRQDPSSPYSGVISIFRKNMQARIAPTIFGDGEQTRDFIAVHDVARANVIAATRPNLPSGISNICSGTATSLNRLAEILRGLTRDAPPPAYAAARLGDIRHSVGAPELAATELGFTATVPLEQGCAELMAPQIGQTSRL